MGFSGRAWREQLEQAEIRKRDETKELQVFFNMLLYVIFVFLFFKNSYFVKDLIYCVKQ